MCRILLLQNKMSKTSAYILTLMVLLLLPSCKGPKLTQANEQFARGEYFDASKTYRKVYNSLTKKEDRELRGEVAFKMGECYTRLSQFARASAAYQNAIRYHYPDSTAYFLLGRALQAEAGADVLLQEREVRRRHQLRVVDEEADRLPAGAAGFFSPDIILISASDNELIWLFTSIPSFAAFSIRSLLWMPSSFATSYTFFAISTPLFLID